jgi:hypothetical protein
MDTFWCRCIHDRQATHCTSSHCRAYILPSSCQLCRALGRACMHGALPSSKLARALFFSKRNLLTAGTTEPISIFSAEPVLWVDAPYAPHTPLSFHEHNLRGVRLLALRVCACVHIIRLHFSSSLNPSPDPLRAKHSVLILSVRNLWTFLVATSFPLLEVCCAHYPRTALHKGDGLHTYIFIYCVLRLPANLAAGLRLR